MKNKRGRPSMRDQVKPVRLDDMTFNPNLFVPIKTDTKLDRMFSTEGGVFPGTNTIIIGDPGIGKSTVCLDMLANVGKNGYKTLFISAEMNEIDLYPYLKRFPKFGQLDIIFPDEYEGNIMSVLREALKEGYDMVLVDSLAELTDSLRVEGGGTRNQYESELLDLFISHNKAQNDAQKNTAFLIIQQMTKGGVFVGGNKIKHMTTAMIELKFDADRVHRQVEFTKNRRGLIGDKLIFEFIENDCVTYRTFVAPPQTERRGRPRLNTR